MAIGGVVITVRPDARKDVEIALIRFSELSVYGSDEKGNIIATIKSSDLKSIERIIRKIEKIDPVYKVHLAYLNIDTPENVSREEGQ